MMPLMPLRKKMAANCHDCGWLPSMRAEIRKAAQLATPMNAWSNARNFPRTGGGTRVEIQGSHAQLEMPRSRLKMKRRKRIKDSFVSAFRNVMPGMSAMAKMKITRLRSEERRAGK